MVTVQTKRPTIEIDGTRYIVEQRIALLADLLLNAKGALVNTDRIASRLQTSRRTVPVQVCKLRRIFRQHGYILANETGDGYRLVRISQ